MALIQCPKCGKQFSDRAEKCPQCGISKEEAQRLIAEKEAQEAAERERLRKEREAKAAEEARLRAEKRAEWWMKNTKWVIKGCVLILLCFSAYIFSVNRDSVVAANKSEISIFRFRSSTLLIIPEGVTKIENNAFSSCPSIISVTIPDRVTSIGTYAFLNCSGLTSITIGTGVTNIGSEAFEDTNLSTVAWNAKNCIDFEEENTPFYYSTASDGWGIWYDIREQITTFSFGNEVEHIPAYLCSGLNNITSIEIPNSVTSIGVNAFLGCTSLSLRLPERFRGNINLSDCKSVTYY